MPGNQPVTTCLSEMKVRGWNEGYPPVLNRAWIEIQLPQLFQHPLLSVVLRRKEHSFMHDHEFGIQARPEWWMK